MSGFWYIIIKCDGLIIPAWIFGSLRYWTFYNTFVKEQSVWINNQQRKIHILSCIGSWIISAKQKDYKS